MLAVPLIHVSGGSGVTVQPRQPPLVRLPADAVPNFITHELIVYDRSLAYQVNWQLKAASADGSTLRDDRFVNRFQLIEAAIHSLSSGQQAALAVDLASLVQPFADISQDGQPKAGLSVVADAIQTTSNDVEIERARHVLWSTPELQDDEEPDGPALFSLGATITWIYAADSLTSAPSDGAVNAFKRAVDLLDAADETLGDTGLTDRCLDAVEVAIDTGQVALPPELRQSVRAAAERLRQLPRARTTATRPAAWECVRNGENGAVTGDYEQLTCDLIASIRLGYEVEADDPNTAFELPPDDEVRWLAAWLVSEGWTRPAKWPHD